MIRSARWCLVLALGLGALAAPAAAYRPLTRPQVLVWDANDPAGLRRALRSYADSAGGGDTQSRLDAGEAWFLLGSSYTRDGLADSAVACLRRAVGLRADRPERLALADLLIARGTPEALTEARHALADEIQQAGFEPAAAAAQSYARLAWLQAKSGRADSAAALVREWCGPLVREPEWAKRFAALSLDAGDAAAAWRLALPVAVRSRGTDPAAMAVLRGSARTGGPTMDADAVVAREAARRDTLAARQAAALGARRLTVRAEDGFPLSVLFVPAPQVAAPRLALVLAQPSDTLALYDSLAVQWSRRGAAVAIVDPRGARGSVAASAPGPDAWDGRERAMLERTARDARVVFDALVRQKLVAPRGALAAATGSLAMSAALAAAADPRFNAVALIVPAPAVVDRGALRASLAASAVPLFVQVAPEEVESALLADRLAASLPIRQSRVADTGQSGRSADVFRADPKASGRLFSWWLDVLVRPPATRPSPRR